ncbi:Uncharacterized protein TCM_032082 [Theobroma cacao]|uniref:Uncharacterized protein n=1 Tax=Theobroma cacao TaxID=3641 RepID=A0A061F9T4_THECC|nr:Uncharacterized protein TCM_032082 [Theobroma cacao]
MEHGNGSITKHKSRDVIFLKEDFPSKGEIHNEIYLYEIEGLDIGPPSSLIENVKEIPQTFGDRESHLPLSSSITIDKDPQVDSSLNLIDYNDVD